MGDKRNIHLNERARKNGGNNWDEENWSKCRFREIAVNLDRKVPPYNDSSVTQILWNTKHLTTTTTETETLIQSLINETIGFAQRWPFQCQTKTIAMPTPWISIIFLTFFFSRCWLHLIDLDLNHLITCSTECVMLTEIFWWERELIPSMVMPAPYSTPC